MPTSTTSRSENGRGPARRAGFSLVELMGILLLLGLLSGLAFMSWQALVPRTKLNSAVRELAATLHETRSDAISRNAEFQVEYFFEEDADHPVGYRVITPFRADGTGGLAAHEEERFCRAWHTLPDGVELVKIVLNGEEYDRGRVVVDFDRLGSASDHTITIVQRPYDNFYTIEVLALTGLIRFHDGIYAREYPDDNDFR